MAYLLYPSIIYLECKHSFNHTIVDWSKKYFKEHPELSNELINALLDKKISIIGVDFAGVRNGKEHVPMDQYCADKGVFIIENLCNLKSLIYKNEFIVNTYPMNYADMTGLPCRIVAEI